MSILRRIVPLAIVLSIITLSLSTQTQQSAKASTATKKVYLPSISYVWESSPFGFEVAAPRSMLKGNVFDKAVNLQAKWIRIGPVSWRAVQPQRGGTYNWGVLAEFEAGLIAAARAGLTPIVSIHDNPRWATTAPTSCAAIRVDVFEDYRRFMVALVDRYKVPPYNVKHWEFGNEVDVDPSLVSVDSIFGCWGDAKDQYYGGEHYGRMLKYVVPSIRAVDPSLKVLLGGLMVFAPNTQPCAGSTNRPECFLPGILQAGAADSFDIVAYHGHFSYYGGPIEYYPTNPLNPWTAYGGPAKGKPAYIREIMSRYGVSKPLFFDEASLGCPVDKPEQKAICSNPSPQFFDWQANHVARMMLPTASVGVKAIIWYALEGPGWRNSGLLDKAQQPRPAYHAYKQLIKQASGSVMPPPMISEYGSQVEAYRLAKSSRVVDAAWTFNNQPHVILLPESKFIAAYGRDGEVINPPRIAGNVQLTVSARPIYIHRAP
jgi:hypothetical protein